MFSNLFNQNITWLKAGSGATGHNSPSNPIGADVTSPASELGLLNVPLYELLTNDQILKTRIDAVANQSQANSNLLAQQQTVVDAFAASTMCLSKYGMCCTTTGTNLQVTITSGYCSSFNTPLANLTPDSTVSLLADVTLTSWSVLSSTYPAVSTTSGYLVSALGAGQCQHLFAVWLVDDATKAPTNLVWVLNSQHDGANLLTMPAFMGANITGKTLRYRRIASLPLKSGSTTQFIGVHNNKQEPNRFVLLSPSAEIQNASYGVSTGGSIMTSCAPPYCLADVAGTFAETGTGITAYLYVHPTAVAPSAMTACGVGDIMAQNAGGTNFIRSFRTSVQLDANRQMYLTSSAGTAYVSKLGTLGWYDTFQH